MTVQRLAQASYGKEVYPSATGVYMYYASHEEVTKLLREQLNNTQNQLEQSQETVRRLTNMVEGLITSLRGYI